MRTRRVGLGIAVALLALPALAAASPNPTATAIRIGDHPAYVRVVVDFAGGTVKGSNVQFSGITRYDAAVLVFHARAKLPPLIRSAYGVTARLRPGPSHLAVALTFKAGTIKYLSYAVVTGNRLAIDLWKSAPPKKAAEIRKGPGGCLSLSSWHVERGTVTVSGTEHKIFEHMFQVVLRGPGGKVLGRRTAVHGPGLWTTHVHYTASHRRTGTLEAVAFTAKDGALECIAQVRVNLPAS